MAVISDFVFWCVCIILLSIVWKYFQRRRRWAAIIDKIPGPKGIPIFGVTWKMLTSRENIAKASRALLEPYGKYPVVRLWAGPFPVILLTKAESAKVLLSSNKHSDKAIFYRYLMNWIGDGLLTSTGHKWQQRRKLITPSFHFQILENFLLVMNEQSKILVQVLEKQSQQNVNSDFDIYPLISRCTLDIICETAMGQGVHAQLNADSEYLNAVNDLTRVIKMRMNRPWLSPNWIFRLTNAGKIEKEALKIVHGFTNKIIKMKRENFKTDDDLSQDNEEEILGKKRRVALLDMLLKESSSGNQPLTDEDIREEVDTFMFEGHDTTAVGISWALYCIGQLPEIQQKMYDELYNIFGDSDRDATTEDFHHMKYMDLVLKESLRCFPPVPTYGRAIKEKLEICGYEIPPGVTVIITPFLVHRDLANYIKPDEFNPDRFLAENSQNRDPYAFLPFSAGLRNCIGQKFAVMEEKAVISRILRSFVVTSVEEKDILSNLVGELVLRPIRGIKVKLQPRPKI
uniref:Cytochrome P450 4GL1v2 n=1 Tax=Chamberlinius hualienensis TaxID=1551368 RepID=A0A1J1E3Q5_9MYRI|nr:cytochrome P450 4GL1v2 [Chamberlinius hualienensis]